MGFITTVGTFYQKLPTNLQWSYQFKIFSHQSIAIQFSRKKMKNILYILKMLQAER